MIEMSNYEKYIEAFHTVLNVSEREKLEKLKYQDIPEWDSVGHMSLVAELEDAFAIEMETDDIIDFNSFKKGIEIMKKYNIDIK